MPCRLGLGRRWGRGWLRAGVGLACALAIGSPQLARAQAAEEGQAEGGVDPRPWGRGTLVPTFGLGAGGFFSDIANVSFGLGFNYYIVAGLSAGLSFSDTILIYRSAFKARFPGIEEQLPTNIFDVTPTLQYVFFRSRRFSPYVYGGVGPLFFNHGAGTYGQWVAGPGVYLNVAGPLYVNLGVGFSGLFPTAQCQDGLTYVPSDPTEGALLLDLCSFRWGPQIGMVLAFGGGKKKRRERRRRKRDEPGASPTYEPAHNPMHEVVEEPEPESPAVAPIEEAPATEEVAPPPSDVPSPSDVPPPSDVSPPSDAPTDVADPPSEAPPPSDVATSPNDGSTDVPSPVQAPSGHSAS